jgi:predicted heme/steroid binding protein
MNRTSKIILFSVVIVVLVALVVSINGNEPKVNSSNDNSVVAPVSNNSSVSNGVSGGISIDELAKHNLKNDCWVVYKGKVYDVTSWLTKHPGGVNAIAKYCGTQGFEDAFTKQHGTSKASLFLQVAKLMGDFKMQGSLS